MDIRFVLCYLVARVCNQKYKPQENGDRVWFTKLDSILHIKGP